MNIEGLWGNWYEFGARGWEQPRRAFVAGAPESAEQAGKAHLAVFGDPGRDQATQWHRKGVTIAKEPPTRATPAEPTQEGHMGLFVLDHLPATEAASTIPTTQRRRALKS